MVQRASLGWRVPVSRSGYALAKGYPYAGSWAEMTDSTPYRVRATMVMRNSFMVMSYPFLWQISFVIGWSDENRLIPLPRIA